MDKWEYQNKPCYLENRVAREMCKRRTACIMYPVYQSKCSVKTQLRPSWTCQIWQFCPYIKKSLPNPTLDFLLGVSEPADIFSNKLLILFLCSSNVVWFIFYFENFCFLNALERNCFLHTKYLNPYTSTV